MWLGLRHDTRPDPAGARPRAGCADRSGMGDPGAVRQWEVLCPDSQRAGQQPGDRSELHLPHTGQAWGWAASRKWLSGRCETAWWMTRGRTVDVLPRRGRHSGFSRVCGGIIRTLRAPGSTAVSPSLPPWCSGVAGSFRHRRWLCPIGCGVGSSGCLPRGGGAVVMAVPEATMRAWRWPARRRLESAQPAIYREVTALTWETSRTGCRSSMALRMALSMSGAMARACSG